MDSSREKTGIMSYQNRSLGELLDTFQLFDKNKDGCISFNELRSAYYKLKIPFDEAQLKRIFQQRDNISFDEFRRLMEVFGQRSADAYFQETFRAFDKNSDGFITAKEIKKTMKELGEPLSTKQAKDMLKVADTNRDGKLSIEEFQILFNYLTQQIAPSPSISSPSVSMTFE